MLNIYGHWRTGTKINRNIYLNDEPVLVAVGSEDEANYIAKMVVTVMNNTSKNDITILETLTRTQEECTKLLEENRELKEKLSKK